MFGSVRARLTLWYVSVFGLLLIGFSIFVYVLISRSLYERLDHSLSNVAMVMATEFLSEVTELKGDFTTAAIETLNELQLPNVQTAIFEGDHMLASNYSEGLRSALPQYFLSAQSNNGGILFRTIDGFGEDGARLAALPVRTNGGDFFVAVAEPLDDLAEQLASIRRNFYIGLPATVLIAGMGGFLLARKSLSPVLEMSSQAKRISATSLQERLSVSNPEDELGKLAEVINELLSRLEHSFEKMRQFMADASHELRTPLSIIRGEADVALSMGGNEVEYKDSLTIIQDEAKQLSQLVDDMLALARADAGQHPIKAQEFYLNDLAQDACRAMQVLAARKGVTVTLDPADDISFHGDEDMLRRLILNLLDNAIKYTPSGGSVFIKLEVETADVKIIVSDTGVGIHEKAAPHVFERFYRIDKARSRAEGGSGLGLAIAKWVAEAHNGSIDLVSHPGRGSTFTVSLPR